MAALDPSGEACDRGGAGIQEAAVKDVPEVASGGQKVHLAGDGDPGRIAKKRPDKVRPGIGAAAGEGLRLRGLTLLGADQRAPVAFLAALTCVAIVSLVVSSEPLASAPIASEVFSETPRTSWLLA